jgi:glycerate 2-kinase
MKIPDPKDAAERIFMAALRAVDPYAAVKAQKERLVSAFEAGGFRRLMVVGFGKASYPMALAMEDTMGDLIESGIIITKYGHLGKRTLQRIKAIEAAHPVPDESGERAAKELLAMLEGASGDTLVVCLISGGGSALLAAPADGVTLSDKQAVTSALLRAGADINELNAVRKHISLVKGGRLVRAAHPARVISLIISDVIGDPLDVIASGPTSSDASTWQDALGVIRKYGINSPANVVRLIEDGAAGAVPDSPKPGDPLFERVKNMIIGSNRMALTAARDEAEALGFEAEILTDSLSGEAREAARKLASESSDKGPEPRCLIAGGETTVTVKGSGKGGRNTELALAFSLAIEGKEGITLLAAGTDGTDGPTDAAGAIVDCTTARKARAMGIEPRDYLENSDSYTFFDRAGGLLRTGPTGTNVMDIDIILLT